MKFWFENAPKFKKNSGENGCILKLHKQYIYFTLQSDLPEYCKLILYVVTTFIKHHSARNRRFFHGFRCFNKQYMLVNTWAKCRTICISLRLSRNNAVFSLSRAMPEQTDQQIIFSFYQAIYLSVLRIRILNNFGRLNPHPRWECGSISGSRRANITHKNRKK